MAKYIFLKDAKLGTYVGPLQGRATFMVEVKKGDIVIGEEKKDTNSYTGQVGHASVYLSFQSPKGEVHVSNNPSLGPNGQFYKKVEEQGVVAPDESMTPSPVLRSSDASYTDLTNKWFVWGAALGALGVGMYVHFAFPKISVANYFVLAILGGVVGASVVAGGNALMKKA